MADFIINVATTRTFVTFIAIGIVFYILYRYVLSRLHPFSMIGALLRYAATWCLLMLGLSMVFLSPEMRWTLNWNDWVQNFVFARVLDNPFAAHVFSYLTIPLVYFGALWLTRNELFSFAYAASVVFMHETIWYGFTAGFAFSQGLYWPTLISSTAFMFMICCFGAVLLHVYKFPWKWFTIPFIYTVLFDSIWFWWNNWKITVTIFDVMGKTQYQATPYYFDIGANLFENLGWLTLFPIMLLTLYLAKPRIERLLGRDLKELAHHGWIH